MTAQSHRVWNGAENLLIIIHYLTVMVQWQD